MKWLAFLSLIFLASLMFLQTMSPVKSEPSESSEQHKTSFPEIKPQFVKAVAAGVSRPASSFAPASPEHGIYDKKTADEKARLVPNREPFRKQKTGVSRDAETNFARVSSETMPAPMLSFDGLSSSDNAAAYGFRIIPPDPFGDVGMDHFVQAVNALVRIYDKQGNALTPPFKLSTLFSPLGTPCSMRNDGDPIVLYDTLTDRWLISQFCTSFPPFRQLIAISQTGDPTGAYFLYEFVMPNIKLNDYPKIGVWTNAFFMTTDQFIGGDFAGTGVFAFDKAKMLAGERDAAFIYFDLASPSTIRLGGLLPVDLDGLKPPAEDAPGIFVGYDATEYGDPQDALRVFEFGADFENAQNSTFTERPESPLPVASFDPTSPNGRSDIRQPAPGEPLDSQSDRLMYRAAYRNLGAYESIVFNQTVRTSPDGAPYRAGVRIYELRKTNGTFAVREQATIGSADVSRWMGSAAQDHEGSIAVGYSLASENKKPSIFYAGRKAGDPPGVFRAETPLIEGTGVQKAFGFRWGDYTMMSVDPRDDCTFWMSNEYYTQASEDESEFGWLTRIGTFKFPGCKAAPRSVFRGTVTDRDTGQPIGGAIVTANRVFRRDTRHDGGFGDLTVAPGTYTLTASAKGFRPQSFVVSVGDGQIWTQNFRLEPVAVPLTGKFRLTGESCRADKAIDPGETVSISLALSNAGRRGAGNLVAELLPTGGVVNPSEARSYGAVGVNARGAAREFTFTVSPSISCGGIVRLTFRLRDGAEDLGTIAIDLQTGKKRVAFREDFDSVAAPALPGGWTTSASLGQQKWATSAVRSVSPPNSAFSPAPSQRGINELVSPAFQINSTEAELEFRNWYELETTFLRNRLFDGSVLEIKIGANDWQDIEAAGGAFLAGGYDGLVDGCCQNPLAGRRAWSGRSGIKETPEFITSKVKLPAAAAGQSLRFRFRVGTDIGTFREGQYIDDLIVADGFECACRMRAPKPAIFDFDGDGRTDISVFRPSDDAGETDFFISNSSNGFETAASWGSVGDRAVNADYDGDGKTDLAVFRPSNKTWFILNSSDNTISIVYFGLADDQLTPADFDGDRRADVAVFRPSDGNWYVLQSSIGQMRVQRFGVSEDLAAPADYDGDGKTDLAVFRPSKEKWHVLRSSDDKSVSVKFGTGGDRPVAGDYDGDRRADFAVFRPSNATWYLLRSLEGFAAVKFGLSEDKPLQGDFDGDGRRDIAVYRPSNSTWYVLKSSDSAVFARRFGASGGIAIPSIFVP